MRASIVVAAALTGAALFAPAGAATSECRGIQACIRVPGPWVIIPGHGSAQYLLSCPQGRSIVGGLDALATSRAVRVSFEGRLGAPVQPGQTTTRYAFFRAVSTSARTETFRPVLGCIPTGEQRGGGGGGDGRSTVSARVTPAGLPLEFRARAVAVRPGDVRIARISCLGTAKRVGAWHAVAFRTEKPPKLTRLGLVRARHRFAGKQTVVLTAASAESLPPDARAIVQVGAVCAPR